MSVRNCTSCGNEIPAKRLAARPSATLCFACQTKTEESTPVQQTPRAYMHPSIAMMHKLNSGGLNPNILLDTVNDVYEKEKDRG